MKRHYDIVYLTNTPSHYKVRLMERVAAAGSRVLMVFMGYDSKAVNVEPKSSEGFDCEFLYDGDIDRRPKIRCYRRLCRLMRQVDAKTLLFSGWMIGEYNFYALTHRLGKKARKHNAIVMESTLVDCLTYGVKGYVKRLICKRMGRMIVPSAVHHALADALRYQGEVIQSGGVGIIDDSMPRKLVRERSPETTLRYLFVGRLSPEKNLRMLIEAFIDSGRQLTIVGDGPQRAELEAIASTAENIAFEGFVENNRLGEVFARHDVLVLPSLLEPWGLVVEEALYHGLPVVVSRAVGATGELVEDTRAGVVFDSSDKQTLLAALASMEQRYDRFAAAAADINFPTRFTRQITTFSTKESTDD